MKTSIIFNLNFKNIISCYRIKSYRNKESIIYKKRFIFAFLFLINVLTAFGQEKPRLGIIPFTGGQYGDGETIATLFSFLPEILREFTVVPRTSAVNTIIAEQNFQMAGYTDSDKIARIGQLLNADFVVSGHIRRLGDRNLIISTIINVETFEQKAGDYRTYRSIEEVRNLLPEISQKLIIASRRDTSSLPRLAIAPFSVANVGVNIQDAETLAQILAVEISNAGSYAVLPRTTTMQDALRELEYQQQGYTAEEGAKALGRAINADFVLSAEARSLGVINMFTAQILHVEDGSLLVGDARDYRIVDDGITLMAELALLLTDRERAIARISARNRELSRSAMFGDSAKLWSLGVSVGTSFTDPWLIGTIRGTIAPFRYSFFEIGFDLGFITEEEASYYSIYPFANYAFFLPFSNGGGCYAGVGGGYMHSEYSIGTFVHSIRMFAANFTIGFNIRNFIDISYTMRTNFDTASNKIAVGFSYRFKE